MTHEKKRDKLINWIKLLNEGQLNEVIDTIKLNQSDCKIPSTKSEIELALLISELELIQGKLIPHSEVMKRLDNGNL